MIGSVLILILTIGISTLFLFEACGSSVLCPISIVVCTNVHFGRSS
uniref:Uncharacterized protein n=1 Tax=Siphoviridae sp. ctcfw7 TaxID=2826394 RepID=A0A8S5MGF2_9CAUD|nr:MAG TPA: hypothetical protein [Siphoviridae sp. ctcfw7]